MDSSKDTKLSKLPGLTPRVLLVVLLLAPVNAYILVEMEVVRYTYPSWIVPLAYVLFTLMVVVVLNYLIRRMASRCNPGSSMPAVQKSGDSSSILNGIHHLWKVWSCLLPIHTSMQSSPTSWMIRVRCSVQR